MNPEEFIQKNPFPSNGSEINDFLVKEIQDPAKSHLKRRNLYKLFKNNARLIYLVYKQFNYNQTLPSIMSFVYEGLQKATETYDSNIGMPFYHYAIQTTRGLLQNYYNYNNDLVHVPVMKKKKANKKDDGIKLEFCDINDYSENQYQNIVEDENETEENSLSLEMDMIIKEYENRKILTPQAKQGLDILKLYRKYNLKEISSKTNMNTVKLRKIIDRTTTKLKNFYIDFQKELNEH